MHNPGFKPYKKSRTVCLLVLLLPFMNPGWCQVCPPASSGINWLYLSGRDAEYDLGDDDHIQNFYLLIPDSIEGEFQIEIENKTDKGKNEFLSDEITDYELRIYGHKNVYINPDLKYYLTDSAIYSNIHEDPFQHIYLSKKIPIYLGENIPELTARLFRIEYEGLEGETGKHYRLKVLIHSSREKTNVEGELFYDNLSFLLPENPVRLSFPLPVMAEGLSLKFFDMDNEGEINITSIRRKGQRVIPSSDNSYRLTLLNVFSEEKGDTISIDFKNNQLKNNNISINWLIEDLDGKNITFPFWFKSISEFPHKNSIRQYEP